MREIHDGWYTCTKEQVAGREAGTSPLVGTGGEGSKQSFALKVNCVSPKTVRNTRTAWLYLSKSTFEKDISNFVVRGHRPISGKTLSLTRGAGYSLGYRLHRFVRPQRGHGFSVVLTILIINRVGCLHSGLIGTHHAEFCIKSRMTENFFSPITRHVKERTYIASFTFSTKTW